jgi:hypothetical protein
MAVLYAKVGGAWVPIGGGVGSEEVFVGPDDPGGGYDLWYDTDATSIVAAPWTALVMTNGWLSYGAGYTPQYRKIGDNVQIRGLMKDGPSASPFTLPVGFRPAIEETFPVFASNALGGISIAVSGAAAIQSPTLTGAGRYVYLSGIIFSTVA